VYQYDITSPDIEHAYTRINTTDIHGYYANFQYGPDNILYLGRLGNLDKNCVSAIYAPDKAGAMCDFRDCQMELPSNYGYRIPRFPNYDLGPDPCYVANEEVQESGLGSVILYPNPASDKIYLHVDKEGQYTLTIYNMQGLKAFEEVSFAGKELTADISSLSSGYYYCVLKEKDGEFFTKRFAVIR
jgi:hypothetical protein